jgi:hypothetical protein
MYVDTTVERNLASSNPVCSDGMHLVLSIRDSDTQHLRPLEMNQGTKPFVPGLSYTFHPFVSP